MAHSYETNNIPQSTSEDQLAEDEDLLMVTTTQSVELLRARIVFLEDRASEDQKEIEHQKNMKERVSEALKTAEQNYDVLLDKYNKDKELADKFIATLTAQKKNISEKHSEESERLDKLEDENINFRSMIQELREDLMSKNEEIIKLQSQPKQAVSDPSQQQRIERMRFEVMSKTNELEYQRNKIEELEEKVRVLTEKTGNQETEHTTLNEKFGKVTKELYEINLENVELKKNHEELKDKFEKASSDLKEVIEKETRLKNHIKNQMVKVKQPCSECPKLKEQIERLNKDHNEKLCEKEDKLAETLREKTELERTSNEKREEIGRLLGIIGDLQQQTQQIESDKVTSVRTSHEKDIEEMDKKIANLDKERKELQEKLEDTVLTMKQFERKVATKDGELKTCKNEIEYLKTVVEQYSQIEETINNI